MKKEYCWFHESRLIRFINLYNTARLPVFQHSPAFYSKLHVFWKQSCNSNLKTVLNRPCFFQWCNSPIFDTTLWRLVFWLGHGHSPSTVGLTKRHCKWWSLGCRISCGNLVNLALLNSWHFQTITYLESKKVPLISNAKFINFGGRIKGLKLPRSSSTAKGAPQCKGTQLH